MITVEDMGSTIKVSVNESHPYILSEEEAEAIERFIFMRAGVAHVVEDGKHWLINPKQRGTGEYFVADSSLVGEWRSLTVGYEDARNRALSKWVKTIPDGPKVGEQWEVTNDSGHDIVADVVSIGEELYFAWKDAEDSPCVVPIERVSGHRSTASE